MINEESIYYFNAGYLIRKHDPELYKKISWKSSGPEYIKGYFEAGANEFVIEQMIARNQELENLDDRGKEDLNRDWDINL